MWWGGATRAGSRVSPFLAADLADTLIHHGDSFSSSLVALCAPPREGVGVGGGRKGEEGGGSESAEREPLPPSIPNFVT